MLFRKSTQIVLISHAGSHSRDIYRVLKASVAPTCRQWLGCPQVVCEVENGKTIRHMTEASMESRMFVLLLRDPRDVVTALWDKRGLHKCLNKFECAIQHIHSVAAWADSRYRRYTEQGSLVLFYEDLASQPYQTMRSLASFLNVDFSFSTEEMRAWQNAIVSETICQTRSTYPAWVGDYVSSAMRQELSQNLWDHWASCNITWSPDPCPLRTTLELHEGRHGDVCRWPDGHYTCPVLCRQSHVEPYCAADNTEPCRASESKRWHERLVPNPLTPRVMHTFYEPTAKDNREGARQQTLASWATWMAIG